MKAIDISYCQRDIDLKGYDYVIIKATQRNYIDKYLEPHCLNAIQNRVPFGLYHFLEAKTLQEAKKEAEFFCMIAKRYKAYCPYLYLDCEVYGLENEKCGKALLTDIVITFMEVVKKNGFIPVLYTNPDHLENRLEKNRIEGNYYLWLACWGSYCPNYKKILVWQYGLENGVDADKIYFDQATMAVLGLAAKGFISSPVYWIQNYKKVKWLDRLLIQANQAYSYRWKESQKTDWAISKLVKDGVINSPNYWKQVLIRKPIKYLDQLFLNLGGGQF